MKCEDCVVVDFCQAGFWYKNCRDWDGYKDDNKQCADNGRLGRDTPGIKISTEDEPYSTLTAAK